ncbi:LETM1 domain-containing protein 1 [Contarinia nasturtii]|uniref:LETM1 domain-containing protein 1 n=1 Tax=Contarinia nasturtii TaxID=265458 RepID=UPI0012D43ADA|nr:LETM1 domain-containing protein 1 [Contarinia nasturtii]
MASVLIRGLARGCHHRPIALQQKFYSAKPSQKLTTSDNGSTKEPPENDKSKLENSSTVEKPEHRLSKFRTRIEESQKKAENVRDDIRGYALNRFINYIKNYEKILEKKFPGAMKVYRVFMDGVKYITRDSIDYVKIRSKMLMQGKDQTSLSRRELELYYQMPHDIRKVGPMIFISAIPFAHYVTMPIAYMYPRFLLTHHFWTLQQRSEFAVINLRDRLVHNRAIFRSLQSKLSTIINDKHYEQWKDMLGKIGSGIHPTVDEIIAVKQLFAEIPYKTSSLSYTHIKHLAGLHGIKGIFTIKSKLTFRAMCIHNIDMAIKREGGTQTLTTETLRDSCFMRGLNASNMTNDELIKFLDDWIAVSTHINETNFSLFLHLPILLTYNHPNNWQLLYQNR